MDALTTLLYDLGITPNLKGFECIKYSVCPLMNDKDRYSQCITKRLYPDVGKILDCTAFQVERNIRYCINKAIELDHGEIKTLIGISPYKNKLTNNEFLFALTEVIIKEKT